MVCNWERKKNYGIAIVIYPQGVFSSGLYLPLTKFIPERGCQPQLDWWQVGTGDWQPLSRSRSRVWEQVLMFPRHLGFTGYNMKSTNPVLPSPNTWSLPPPGLARCVLGSDNISATCARKIKSKTRNNKQCLRIKGELLCRSKRMGSRREHCAGHPWSAPLTHVVLVHFVIRPSLFCLPPKTHFFEHYKHSSASDQHSFTKYTR